MAHSTGSKSQSEAEEKPLGNHQPNVISSPYLVEVTDPNSPREHGNTDERTRKVGRGWGEEEKRRRGRGRERKREREREEEREREIPTVSTEHRV